MKNKTLEQIAQLEETLRKLKNQYDLFFSGATKLPPSEEHKRFDRTMREMATERMRDNTARFRFNNLSHKYSLLREMWGRRMREQEEGPLHFKRRQQALKVGATLSDEADDSGAAEPVVTTSNGNSYVKVSGETNGAAISELHARISEAQQQLGGSTLSIEQVSLMIDRQIQALQSRYGSASIGFRVEVVDGKVKLKAKPLQD